MNNESCWANIANWIKLCMSTAATQRSVNPVLHIVYYIFHCSGMHNLCVLYAFSAQAIIFFMANKFAHIFRACS